MDRIDGEKTTERRRKGEIRLDKEICAKLPVVQSLHTNTD